MDTNTILLALLGGALIGIAFAALLLLNGRIAGVSGILGGLVSPKHGDVAWRGLFVAGLVAGGAVIALLRPESFPQALPRGGVALAVAGLLVGFGARLAGGCTSGHGVCGIGRLSLRSVVATAVFIAAGAVAVVAARHLLGGTP